MSVCFCLGLIKKRTRRTVKKLIICITDVNFLDTAWELVITVRKKKRGHIEFDKWVLQFSLESLMAMCLLDDAPSGCLVFGCL